MTLTWRETATLSIENKEMNGVVPHILHTILSVTLPIWSGKLWNPSVRTALF